MNRIKRFVKKQFQTLAYIPFNGKPELLVEVGSKVNAGDVLFYSFGKSIAESHDLVSEIGISLSQAQTACTRLKGEYVVAGDIIAESPAKSGLVLKRIVAGTDGVINYDNIDRGIVNILSEMTQIDVKSYFSGVVNRIDLKDGIFIDIYASEVDCFASVTNPNPQLFPIEILKDGKSVFVEKDLEMNYTGKYVFAGRYVYGALIQKILDRGAKGVIVYAMDYYDYESLSQEIIKNKSQSLIVLGGFGQIPWNNCIEEFLNLVKNQQIRVENIEGTGKNRIIITQPSLQPTNVSIYNQVKVGNKVWIGTGELWGSVGVVDAFDQSNEYCFVITDGGQKSLIAKRNLMLVNDL